MPEDEKSNFSCPVPLAKYPKIVLAHGGGGKLMIQLINDMFLTAFDNDLLLQRGDSAILGVPEDRLAFTTDSYVVSPLFFPGGDIGSLAVNGTVNDLAVAGARPLYLSLGFIIEEGFPMEALWRVVQSIRDACRAAKVRIVTGDTKVVNHGKGDGLYINTSGIGVMEHGHRIGPEEIWAGDAVIVNGDIGRHGMAIMAAREDLGFKGDIESDCAPLAEMILDLLGNGFTVHCMRDLTRGGLATVLCELSDAGGIEMEIEEADLPIDDKVAALGELLGVDPVYSACEGRLVLFIPQEETPGILQLMHKHRTGSEAAVIGRVNKRGVHGRVSMKTRFGTGRIITILSGEQLPRIC
jgi:hydrogenase expression/formation protein HypE